MVLRKLSGAVPLAVVTNKRSQLSSDVLEQLGLLRYVTLVVGPDTAGKGKPSPVPVKYALERMDVDDPTTAVIVGDSSFDISAGKGAGVRTVGVTWGYRPAEELQGADLLVDRVEDLLLLIDS